MILMTSPIAVARNEVRLLPMAVRIPVNTWFKKENMTSPQVMARYTSASWITVLEFRRKNPINGP